MEIVSSASRIGECLEFEDRQLDINGNTIYSAHDIPQVLIPGHGYFPAHRLVYFVVFGESPPHVYRLCRNRRCVEPSHLSPYVGGSNAGLIEHMKTLPGEHPEYLYYVYRLRCPISSRIRYYGMTFNPRERQRQHYLQKTLSSTRPWISRLRKQGLFPRLEVITPAMPVNQAADIEAILIQKSKNQWGAQVLNRYASTARRASLRAALRATKE